MRFDVERRRYPRSRRKITLVKPLKGPGVLNHIDNISANGVLCHTIKPIPLMTKVGIALELTGSDHNRIDCEGIVVRCDPHEQGDDHFKVAILFSKLNEADYKAIRDFVAQDVATEPAAEG